MTPRTLNNQDGIALGPILFIIAILALLAAAIAAGSGAFNANTSSDSNKVMAQSFVDYAEQIKGGVNILLANGCLATQLQFQGANSNAPTNGYCSVFDPRGGAIVNKYFGQLSSAFDPVAILANGGWWGTAGYFRQEATDAVVGVGNPSNGQLLWVLHALNVATCTAINKIVNYNAPGGFAPIGVDYHVSWSIPYFGGTYSAGGPYDFGFESSNVQQGCIYDIGDTDYEYVGVLVAQ